MRCPQPASSAQTAGRRTVPKFTGVFRKVSASFPQVFRKASARFPQGFRREGELEIELELEVESEVEVEIEYISKTEEIFCFGERGRAGAPSRSPAGKRIDFDHFFGLPF